jgi:hypothetical protein
MNASPFTLREFGLAAMLLTGMPTVGAWRIRHNLRSPSLSFDRVGIYERKAIAPACQMVFENPGLAVQSQAGKPAVIARFNISRLRTKIDGLQRPGVTIGEMVLMPLTVIVERMSARPAWRGFIHGWGFHADVPFSGSSGSSA